MHVQLIIIYRKWFWKWKTIAATRPPTRDRSLMTVEELEQSINERLARLYPDGRRKDR